MKWFNNNNKLSNNINVFWHTFFLFVYFFLLVYHYGQGSILPKSQHHLHHFYFISRQQLMYYIDFSPDTPGPLCCLFKWYEIGSGKKETYTSLHTTHTQPQQTRFWPVWNLKCQFDSLGKRTGVEFLKSFWSCHTITQTIKFITVMFKSLLNLKSRQY